MASIDLLEELQLNDYYPQKLSFIDAIRLRGKSQTVCQEQRGLEIIQKLLMLDSTAVVSVTTEINKHLSNTDAKETETKDQSVSGGDRSIQKISVRPSGRSGIAEQSEKKLHPMDLLVVIMNCCDDFLRQYLIEKMFDNKQSIPILLPSVRNGSYTLLLLALKSIVPEVQDRVHMEEGGSGFLSDRLVDQKQNIVSFIRVGNLHRSKSKMLNELLGFTSFNTFFHRDCPGGSAKRLVAKGSIEAAWFQSKTATTDEFNCQLFTVFNLRGDARDHPSQAKFLCQSSTLVIVMVDSFEPFKQLYEDVLKDVMPHTKTILWHLSPKYPDYIDEKYFEFLDSLTNRDKIISEVKYDWIEDMKLSDVAITNDLRQTISKLFAESGKILPYRDFVKKGVNFAFSLDEDKSEYKLGKVNADEIIALILKEPPDCKPDLLPLQGKPWQKIGKLEREQQGSIRHQESKRQDEHFIAEKETEKRRQREKQYYSLMQEELLALTFFKKCQCVPAQTLLYYLNSCKIELDARSRFIISSILNQTEDRKKKKQGNWSKLLTSGEHKAHVDKKELTIENSTFGLEHIQRELGQMYEVRIWAEIRMKGKIEILPSMIDVIHDVPAIAAKLLLMGHPLELMDGDTSNVPITWVEAVLKEIRNRTHNAKLFVLSIIGVQSSGKSTLLNALFGLQFPVSAGKCTRGIYCHLVPVDKKSFSAEFGYILVVDTEGLGSSQCTGDSTFRDNELATFAIGLADTTIVNMKGENWSEMKDILQIVAHGLIRVRKTKAELKLMPRCMFVHQNVSATDAKEKNLMGQEKQLMLLDAAIKAAASKEGFTEITKFIDVIKYDPDSHSRYFPDLWNGTPPKARVNQDYLIKVSELRQHLLRLMRDHPSKLTISSFFLRLSDLWTAMLHNDFVLCFRNTQEIILGTVLNDKISHELDSFKNLSKVEREKIRESIQSFTSIEAFRSEKERLLKELSDAIERNYKNTKGILKDVIDTTDICDALKQKYEESLNKTKDEELRRFAEKTKKDIDVHMKKLEYCNDESVKKLQKELDELEQCTEKMERDKLIERKKEFDDKWQHVIDDYKTLIDERMKLAESEIKDSIFEIIKKLYPKETLISVEWEVQKALSNDLPKATEKDIVQTKTKHWCVKTFVPDAVLSKSQSNVCNMYNCDLEEEHKKWGLKFQNQRRLAFQPSNLEKVISRVCELLGVSLTEDKVPTGADEIRSILPSGYSLTDDYRARLISYVCHYFYNRFLESSKRFLSLADPLADIDERQHKFNNYYEQISAEENIDAVSKKIFDYSVNSFVRDLGELIKAEVCKEDNNDPTFKSKRAFLRRILIDHAKNTERLQDACQEKQSIFEKFMLYVEMAETEDSKTFFYEVIIQLLKEMLTKKCENDTQTIFEKMIENTVGYIIEKSAYALRYAETKGKRCKKEYIRFFKKYMNVGSEIDFRINTLDGFTEAVVEKISNLFATFLISANSYFEELVCKEDKAAIRSLFEKIIGCREKCPFCSAPCSQSLKQHAGDHRANQHYPMGVGGTVKCRGLFKSTEETHNAIEKEHKKPRKLTYSTCQAMVGTNVDIRTVVTVKMAKKWFQSNCHPFKKFRMIEEYKDWDIQYVRDHNSSSFWKWFMAKFAQELAEHYKALCPKIPQAWKDITLEEAKQSLDEFWFTVEEGY